VTDRVPEYSQQELRRADLDSVSAIMAVCCIDSMSAIMAVCVCVLARACVLYYGISAIMAVCVCVCVRACCIDGMSAIMAVCCIDSMSAIMTVYCIDSMSAIISVLYCQYECHNDSVLY
jgi:hypothetical protein